MSDHITAKFGGTSMATPESVEAVIDIIEDDENRSLLLPSAPGRIVHDDGEIEQKVTDALLDYYENRNPETLDYIVDRFDRIISGLGESALGITSGNVGDSVREASFYGEVPTVIQGERWSAEILARSIGATLLDPAQIIRFRGAHVDYESSMAAMRAARSDDHRRYVLAPYYGSDEKGLRVFPRGGSDISGAVADYISGGSLYENWTDVNGVYTADPRLVSTARPIYDLTYHEAREIANGGSVVFHGEAVRALMGHGITTLVRNTFDPEGPCTAITDRCEMGREKIVAIAHEDGLFMASFYQPGLNDDYGYVDGVLSSIAERSQGWNFLHSTTAEDSFSLIFSLDPELKQEQRESQIQDVLGQVKEMHPQTAIQRQEVALVKVIGPQVNQDLARTMGETGHVLSDAKVQVLGMTTDMGSVAQNLFVESGRSQAALQALHTHYFEQAA